jgi:tetratricopeptide (TPR) repeat protein
VGDIIQAVYPDSVAHYYRLALAQKSDFAVSIEKLGYLALSQGEFAEARNWFRSLLMKIDPGDYHYRSQAVSGLAITSFCQGRFDEALVTLKEGIERDRTVGDPTSNVRALKHALRARMLEDLGRPQEAIADVDSALTAGRRAYYQGPHHFLPLKIRLLVETAQVNEALACLAAPIGEPGEPHAWQYSRLVGSAIIHRSEGHLDLAIAELKRANALMPESHPWFSMTLAEYYTLSGDTASALEKYRQVWVHSHRVLREDPPLFLRGSVSFAVLAAEAADASDACVNCQRFLAYWDRRDSLGNGTTAQQIRTLCASPLSAGQF